MNKINIEQQPSLRLVISSIAAAIILVVAFNFAPVVLSATTVFSGYGYGYGYGEEEEETIDTTTCAAEAGNGLSTKLLKGKSKGYISLRWDEVEFTGCAEGEGLNYYQVQVKTLGDKLVESYSDIEGTKKKISVSFLQKNRVYKFRVRAVATDNEVSEWSYYKTFRTKPNKPKAIKVRQKTNNAITLTWKNVKRSPQLKHYKVVVQTENGKTVFKKNVKRRLRKKRVNVRVKGLAPGKIYTANVRSFYSTELKSKWQTKQFKTKSL